MNRTLLYLVTGVLAVVALILGYQLYQDRQKSSLEIGVGKEGISIETK